jgi:hypothetical protein
MLCFRFSRAVVVCAVVFGTAASAAAQDPVQRIRELYASAAYEEALSATAAATPGGGSAADLQIQQYRVFCLVALGRPQEAERVVEDVLASSPRYRPDAGDASPRIQELFAQVRRRVGPAHVQRLYLAGKASMERKDRESAVAQFEELMRLANDPDVRDNEHVGELRLLGAGFLDLSRALPGEAAPRADGRPVPAPGRVTPPVALREKLPSWSPPDGISRTREFRGAIRIQISAKGDVVSAALAPPVHPAYDALLLRAARDWAYTPAQRNGVPVPSEKTVEVVLRPLQ